MQYAVRQFRDIYGRMDRISDDSPLKRLHCLACAFYKVYKNRRRYREEILNPIFNVEIY